MIPMAFPPHMHCMTVAGFQQASAQIWRGSSTSTICKHAETTIVDKHDHAMMRFNSSCKGLLDYCVFPFCTHNPTRELKLYGFCVISIAF